jgi:flagellar hook-associated protein 2
MSGVSSTTGTATSSTSATTYGTNVAPVSFPGIVSGIDYNSIINKLTSLTVAPEQQYNTEITKLTAKNNELVYINSLIATVQSAIQTLSNPDIFNAYDAASSNTSAATAKGIAGQTAIPGSYTIDATSLATSTVITGSVGTAIAYTMNDQIQGNTNAAYNGLPSKDVPLVDSYAQTTAYNSPNGSTLGQITVDGVAVKYDVNSQSLNTIISNINSAVNAAFASVSGFQFNMSYDSTPGDANYDGVVITSNQQISIGSANDSGNLQTVLKLDTATVNNGVSQSIAENGTTAIYANSVVSSGGIGGVSLGGNLNTGYDANVKTPITSGTITINGVKITIDASGDNINSIITKINSSSAGVTASLNAQTGQFSLTSKTTGAQGIVVGGTSYGDTSNFLDAVGLTTQTGATTQVGKQAKVTVTDGSGTTKTYVGNSNALTTAIPGVEIDLVSNDTQPFTINVTQDSSQAVNAIAQFVSAYNAAINEIDTASAAPVVQSTTGSQSQGSSTTGSSQVVQNGGILFGDSTIEEMKNELVNLTTNMFSGNLTYQSFSSIGLNLDSSVNQVTANATTSYGSAGATTTSTIDGTDGQFAQLDTAAFTAALTANPNEVSALFTSTKGLIGQLGAYLTTVTGNPTLVNNSIVGTIPVSNDALLSANEAANTNSINSTQTFIKLLTDRANAQANQLRAEFTNSEALASQYQSEQQTLTAANL